jgi:hypothetical protein
MAAVDSLLNAVPSMPADPAPVIKEPFSASTSYFVPRGASSPVWKIGFRCRQDQNYKKDGALVFCTNAKCKNSADLPKGHKNEFPLFRKWKSGDSNQIMLIHCKDEFTLMESSTDASVTKAASS